MKDIIDLIPSKTMRKAIEEEKHIFTDREKATIIFNCSPDFEERDKRLKKIYETTDNKKLKREIKKTFSEDKKFFKYFKSNDGNFVYIAKIYSKEDDDIENYAACMEYDDAFSACKEYIENDEYPYELEFKIQKEYIFHKGQRPKKKEKDKELHSESSDTGRGFQCVPDYFSGNVGTIFYSNNGVPRDCIGLEYEQRESQNSSSYENGYVFLPHPFEQGDKVKIVGMPIYKYDKDEILRVQPSKENMYNFEEKIRKGCYKGSWLDLMFSFLLFICGDNGEILGSVFCNPIYLEKIEDNSD